MNVEIKWSSCFVCGGTRQTISFVSIMCYYVPDRFYLPSDAMVVISIKNN